MQAWRGKKIYNLALDKKKEENPRKSRRKKSSRSNSSSPLPPGADYNDQVMEMWNQVLDEDINIHVCLIFLLQGFLIGWTAPALTKLLDPALTPLDHALSEVEISILNALSICAPFALLASAAIGNKFGRKKVLVAVGMITSFSWTLVAFSKNYYMLCVGKLLIAQMSGLALPQAITYMSEITSVSVRGYALSMTSVFWNLGIFSMYCYGPYVGFTLQNLIPAGFAIVIASLMSYVPESPVFLLSKGRKKQALEHFRLYNIPPKEYQATFCENSLLGGSTIFDVADYKTNKQIVKELFCVRRNLKALCLVMFINIAQQASGIIPILFHATLIFDQTGSSIPPHLATIIVGAFQLVSIITSNILVEKLGRKPLLMTSCFMSSLSTFALGLSFYFANTKSPILPYIGWLPLVSIISYIFFFCIGLGSLAITITAELLDTDVRLLGSSLALIVDGLSGVLVVFTYRFLCSAVGTHMTFWMYSVSTFMCFFMILFFVPETKGRTSTEIQELL